MEDRRTLIVILGAGIQDCSCVLGQWNTFCLGYFKYPRGLPAAFRASPPHETIHIVEFNRTYGLGLIFMPQGQLKKEKAGDLGERESSSCSTSPLFSPPVSQSPSSSLDHSHSSKIGLSRIGLKIRNSTGFSAHSLTLERTGCSVTID